jgi:hypothetical protein
MKNPLPQIACISIFLITSIMFVAAANAQSSTDDSGITPPGENGPCLVQFTSVASAQTSCSAIIV